MDSKVRTLTIILVISIFALAIGIVYYQNTADNRPKATGMAKESAVSADDINTEAIINKLPDDELHAFLYDETFFDYVPLYSAKRENSISENNLFLLASSVEKDIRVAITDENGGIVKGEEFYVLLDDDKEYKDLDKDGMIFIPDLAAGDYYVSLEEIGDYHVPEEPLKVTVKEQLEYALIDDIDLYIMTEDEINAEVEDAMNVEAQFDDKDETEKTEIVSDIGVAFGIDVSKYQKKIDWERAAKSGVKFAIIRLGYRGSSTGCLVEDPYFRQNIEGAKAAGIKVGVYFFTQATNTVEAVEEASMVAKLCENYQLDYPAFIDTESVGNGGRADNLDISERTAIVKAFCETLENVGIRSGVYASRNWYNTKLNDSELKDYAIWDAEYRDTPKYTGNPISIWQYTSSGMVDGINTRVDLDISYVNW